MTDSTLTNKQSYFLKRLQEAEQSGLNIVQLADQENVSAALLYNYRQVLRRKGYLAPAQSGHSTSTGSNPASPGFETVTLSSLSASSPERIELKTQLANGQPVWMNVPASQLSVALAALSS